MLFLLFVGAEFQTVGGSFVCSCNIHRGRDPPLRFVAYKVVMFPLSIWRGG